MIEETRQRGTTLAAPVVQAALVAALSVGLMGCLVTDDIDFEPPENLPPSIESTPSAQFPLQRLIVLEDTATASGSLPLEVEIRDPNVDQTLFWKAYVDAITGPGVAGGQVAPSGMLTRVPDNISIPRARLTPGCHRVVLLVSEGFVFGKPNPQMGNFVARAVWWAFTKDDSQRQFDPASCQGSP